MNSPIVRLPIAAATQFRKASWQVGKGIPKMVRQPIGPGLFDSRQDVAPNGAHLTVEGTHVDRILLVDGNVEIYWRRLADPGHGHRRILFPPFVSILTSVANEEQWRHALASVDEQELIEEVTDVDGQVWRSGGSVPDHPAFSIERIGLLGDHVEIFASPRAGAGAEKFEERKLFLHLELLPLFVAELGSSLEADEWKATLAESEEAMLSQYAGDAAGDPEDEPLIPDLPPPPSPSAVANGSNGAAS